MQAEHAIGLAGAVFFGVAGLMLAVSVHRGREICRLFEQRDPERYQDVGRPRPGWLNGPRRSAYMRFVMQRHFGQLSDPLLRQEFVRLHRIELRGLVFLLVGFACFGLAFLWLHFWHAPG